MSGLLRARSLFLVCGIPLAACAGRTEPVDPDERPPETVLQVENHSTMDMNIYVVPESGARQRLGMATSLITSYFTIPERHLLGVSSLRFQASAIGSTSTRFSERISVIPGDTVLITLPPG